MGFLTEVGSGKIPWKDIFANDGKAGIQHYFVEHDNPKDAFASIKSSYDFLRQAQLLVVLRCRYRGQLLSWPSL